MYSILYICLSNCVNPIHPVAQKAEQIECSTSIQRAVCECHYKIVCPTLWQTPIGWQFARQCDKSNMERLYSTTTYPKTSPKSNVKNPNKKQQKQLEQTQCFPPTKILPHQIFTKIQINVKTTKNPIKTNTRTIQKELKIQAKVNSP